MTKLYPAPWHKISFDHFLDERLPELLASRLPLAGYSARPEGETTCQVVVDIQVNSHILSVAYPNLPVAGPDGLFLLDERPVIVVPIAADEDLSQSVIHCAGEQLYDYIAFRMGHAPAEIDWDETVARAFLPLDAWFDAFLRETGQLFDTTNWHSRQTHLRRILVGNRKQYVHPSQQGRVDPFEVPEGPNIGRVFTVAMGAEIRDGKLIILDPSPEAALGPNAACIPLLEHDDANRLLMGDNMMRQGLIPPDPEPALVQTGREPHDAGADLWCGRNLLTAVVAWGEGCTEDGLILSQSCAQRLNYPYPAEVGDKLSNRHGTKGVVSQILPDDDMPHLADGTPVEILFSFSGLAMRMNFGQVLEAVLGRLARAEGHPFIAPPFHGPTQDEIRARLSAAGLPESGMERLRAGKDGPELPYLSTVGWVYWYRLVHLARPKLRAVGQDVTVIHAPDEPDVAPHPVFPPWDMGQMMGEPELAALRKAGALHNAREMLTTRVLREVAQPTAPAASPFFQDLRARLAAAGIDLAIERGTLACRFLNETPPGAHRLPRAIPHPWLRERSVDWVGAPPEAAGLAAMRAFTTLEQASDRLTRWLDSAPQTKAVPPGESHRAAYPEGLMKQVESSLNVYCETLLPKEALRVGPERQRFSARAVIAPAVGLDLDQVGLPESIARALFGDASAEQITRSWVILHRAPVVTPTALLAFHPVVVPDPAILLHPQACALLNADFDGDQVAVHLPLSPESQREAGEKLSVAGHLARDRALLELLRPPHEGMWGLAWRSLQPEGRQQIAGLLGLPVERISAPFQQSELAALLGEILDQRGSQPAINAAVALARLGYVACAGSGASLSPSARSQVALPPAPEGSDPLAWGGYIDACIEAVLSGHDYADSNLGPQLLSAAVRARSRRTLHILVGPRGPVSDAAGQTVIVRRSLVEGRTPAELYATVAGARLGLARLAEESEEIMQQSASVQPGAAVTLLARARQSARPGLVFARAAASGETDPLTDEETRLLVGV